MILLWHWCGIDVVFNAKKSFETFFVETAQETSSTIGRTHCRTSGGTIPK